MPEFRLPVSEVLDVFREEVEVDRESREVFEELRYVEGADAEETFVTLIDA